MEEKGSIVTDLVGEMVRLGIVDKNVLPEHILKEHEAREEELRKREEEIMKKAATRGKRSQPPLKRQ